MSAVFIWDFVAETILDQIIDWLYGQIVGFLGNIFAEMGSMGAELFQLSWVQTVVQFFSYLAWALYVTGMVVAIFECSMEYAGGRGNVRQTVLGCIKGFMAASLFSTVPIRLYEFCISLQASLSAGITGYGTSFGTVALEIINDLSTIDSLADFVNTSFLG